MKLYAHQQKIIDADPKKCGLFLGTGSGKSLTALLLAKGDILVICPKTQKEDQNWEREYKHILTDKLEKYNSKSAFPVIKPRLTVMSKEEFRRDAHALPRFNTVIVDEAHTCLGVTPTVRQRLRVPVPKASQLFEALATYLARTKPDRLYLCSATIVKSPLTVWAAMYLLKGLPDSEILGNFMSFRQRFYTKLPMPGREIYAPKRDNASKDRLAKLVRSLGYVGRLEDFFDVPDQSYKTIHVELTPKQQARIKDMRLEYPDPIVQIGKRHQIENGVLAGDEFNKPEVFDNAKLDKILELALEFPRMVIFAKYSAQIRQIDAALTKAGYRTAVLTGETQRRDALFKYANEQEECIFIAQAQISAGWELPLYPVMVFASMSYSFVDRVQAEGRILRANHLKKNLFLDIIVRGGVDEAIQKAIHHKQDFDERIYVSR